MLLHILAPKLSTCVTLNNSRPLSGPYLLVCKMVRIEPTAGADVTKAWHVEGAQSSHPSLCGRLPSTPTQVSLVRVEPGRGLRTHTAICPRTEDAPQE